MPPPPFSVDEHAAVETTDRDRGAPAVEAVTSPVPISTETPSRQALSVSPAAAFAKLGLVEPDHPPSAAAPRARKLPATGAAAPPPPGTSRRRSSAHQFKRPALIQPPVPTTTTTTTTGDQHLHSMSLPASSLLLLSTSAEAAVLESMRFEQGGRTARQAAAMGLAGTGGGGIVTSAPNGVPAATAAAAGAVGGIGGKVAGAVKGRPRSSSSVTASAGAGIKAEKGDREKRERGQVFKCEKCAKVYRHPQCLVKHRWEHTTYWADASKLMLSKHQQVQMLEAAAILATPYGSLPESRSLWPAAVSPSAAGLFGSDRVNIDVLRQGGTAASSPLASISLPIGNAFLGSYADDGQVRDEGAVDVEDEDDEEDEEEGGGESDEVMFEMSINGDDGQSTSGASTAETTSGKASAGSGDEKDSGYASAPRQLPPKPSAAAATASSPPVGFFDTRARSVALSRSSSAVRSPPAALVGSIGSGSSASSITPTTKAHLPPPRIVPSSTSPMLNPVVSSSSLGSVKPPLRPSERSFLVQNPYAASDVRATLSSQDQRRRSSAGVPREDEEEEDDEEMADDGPARWPATVDEVVDMEL